MAVSVKKDHYLLPILGAVKLNAISSVTLKQNSTGKKAWLVKHSENATNFFSTPIPTTPEVTI